MPLLIKAIPQPRCLPNTCSPEKKSTDALTTTTILSPCLDLSGEGIRLWLMENGNLQDYLDKCKAPPISPPTRLLPGHGSRPRPCPRPSRSRCRHGDPETFSSPP